MDFNWARVLGHWHLGSAVGLVFLFVGAASATAADWPGFRGPEVNGQSKETGVLSGQGSFGLRVVWKTSIGSGYSGVAVAKNRVVTMFADGASDVAAAFDARTGRELWRFTIGNTYAGHDGSHTGPISTPVIADGRVYGLGAWGRLFALDIQSGSLLWSTQLVDDQMAAKPHYGFGTSPLMMDGVLVVQIGAEGGALAGFDPKTGKRLWATCEDKVGYQSPLPYQNDGKRGVLAAGSKKLVFVDPASGKSVWEHEHGGGGARGVASLTPVPAGKDRLFLAHKDEASTAIELARGEDGVTFKSLWEGRSIRNSYNVPVYHDGHVYAYSSRFLTCVDVTTGEPRWRSREPGDGFLILVDGHLVIVTKKGSVHVAKLSTEGYEEVASVDVLDDLAWAHPGFADGHIYVRGLGELAKVAIRRGAVATADEEDELDELVQGTEFGRFLSEVEAAGDKASVVQKFMASQKEFPIIEGDNLVHFVYHGEAEDVAVAGDIFGARQERAMRRVAGTNLFYYSTELEPDARSNYVFIRDYAGMTDPKNDRKTTTKVYTDEMEMSFSGEELEMSWFAMPKWKMAGHLAGGEPGRAGKIESREFESTILAEKKPDDEGTEEEVKPKIEFDVYVPPGYERGSERYPVAYIHSGKDARERGMVREMLDHNIGKDVKPVIAVFINFEPRFGQQGYDRMVVEELIPHVDKAFRTLAAAENRAHYGVGFGGFQALMCAFMHPEAGTKVAAQSPFLFGGMLMGLKASIPEAKKRQMDVYLDWGKYDLRNPHENWDMGEANRDFAKRLKKKGFEIAGGEVHDGTGWSSWRNRVDRVFMALFPA